ncbi:TonB-dependent receptor [Biformimicrobium ophioploci]|uniref:TonB-dependent receptor n=1 Tax=Biformimicrobium ophioploci TaxID=3036711 RepID=A0ABQ6LVN6_9GAMM|nr:TonB-dependent receptor [Microbulbifer sp. NKW57]GMG86145.1 TonB-dependent receptor [Microbulbifer sp. NKW57]
MKLRAVPAARRPLAAAISLAMASSLTSMAALAQEEIASDEQESNNALEEITVTATKREMDMQDLPQSIQAFTTDQIEKMGFDNMQDYLKAIPSMSTVAETPGRNEVVFRGISTGTGEWRTDSSAAVYLDEIPMTSPTQQVDPRMVDIQRVEALPGPQGTLFGSSSQSGALRIITNKPDHSGTYGSIKADASSVKHGETGHTVEGWFNLPLVADTLSVRMVAYDTKSAGYIDNVEGSNIFTDTRNTDVVEEDFNDWYQSGARISALWSINESWDAELMIMQQSQRSTGDWKSDPAEGDLEIVRFFKDERTDDWWAAGVTLKGDLGFAELTMTSSFLDREVYYEFDNNIDAQIRARRVQDGEFGYYSTWYDTAFHDEQRVNDQTGKRVSQEIRLASIGDGRLQWMAGAFYEETDDFWDWYWRVDDYTSTPSWQYVNYWYDVPETNDYYGEVYNAKTTQTAVFGEMSYDLTEKLVAGVGVRWFEYDRDRTEQKFWPRGYYLPLDIFQGVDSDTVYKLSLNYHIDDSRMVYATYSEGFRLGGSNSQIRRESVLPENYGPDKLLNHEIGLKSQWLDNSLQFNLSAYLMKWEDMQRNIGDPYFWDVSGHVNAGDAEAKGLEATMTYQVTEHFKLEGSYARSSSEILDDFMLSDAAPDLDPSQDWLIASKGQGLALAPPSKWWLGAEYNKSDLFGDIGGWIRYDHSWTEAMNHDWWNAQWGRPLIKDRQEASLSAGLWKESSWTVSLSVRNLWDDRNAGWIDSGYDWRFGNNGTWSDVGRYVNMPSYNRPREVVLSFQKDFSFQ